MLAYYLHDLSPFLVKFSETSDGTPIGIRWYGVSYLMGFVAAYILLMWLARRKILKVPVDRVPDMVLNGCIWGVLLGGRLGHVLFYDTSTLWDFSNSFPFWGLLKVWQGGMSAHGGVIGVIITLWIWAKKNKVSFINISDCACMVVPLGLLFGRLANFINGELYGEKTSVAWAVKFPTELSMPTNGKVDATLGAKLPGLMDGIAAQANGLLGKVHADMVWDLRTPGELVRVLQSPEKVLPAGTPPDVMTKIQMLVHQQLSDFLPARHPSQLYEAGLEGLALFVICWTLGVRARKPGMAAGAFLTLYPVMRITCEQFRIGSLPWDWLLWTHLSQGVLLSLVMFVPGVIFWIYWARRPVVMPEMPAAT